MAQLRLVFPQGKRKKTTPCELVHTPQPWPSWRSRDECAAPVLYVLFRCQLPASQDAFVPQPSTPSIAIQPTSPFVRWGAVDLGPNKIIGGVAACQVGFDLSFFSLCFPRAAGCDVTGPAQDASRGRTGGGSKLWSSPFQAVCTSARQDKTDGVVLLGICIGGNAHSRRRPRWRDQDPTACHHAGCRTGKREEKKRKGTSPGAEWSAPTHIP